MHFFFASMIVLASIGLALSHHGNWTPKKGCEKHALMGQTPEDCLKCVKDKCLLEPDTAMKRKQKECIFKSKCMQPRRVVEACERRKAEGKTAEDCVKCAVDKCGVKDPATETMKDHRECLHKNKCLGHKHHQEKEEKEAQQI